MNVCFAGYVTDSGTYALVGASALLGGALRKLILENVEILFTSITYTLSQEWLE